MSEQTEGVSTIPILNQLSFTMPGYAQIIGLISNIELNVIATFFPR
jgi:hypothetical protein